MAEPYIPDISKLIDHLLTTKREIEPHRAIVGNCTWRASQLGQCLRRQYLELYLKQEPVSQPDALSLRRFEIGHTWAAQLKRWFRGLEILQHEEYEMHDTDLDVGAHGDFLIGNNNWDWLCGVELKSVQSRWFWYRTKGQETTASPEHMMQTACYDILFRKAMENPNLPEHEAPYPIPWIVLTVSKDDLTMQQDVVTQSHRDEALRRLHALNEAKRTNTPPPCTCTDPNGEWNGNGWKYCDYYTGNPDSRRQKNAKPDGECCVITQQDNQEEASWQPKQQPRTM